MFTCPLGAAPGSPHVCLSRLSNGFRHAKGGFPLGRRIKSLNGSSRIHTDALSFAQGKHQRSKQPRPSLCLAWPALPCPALPCPALPCPALPCPALPCPCRAHTESTDPSYFLDYAFGHGSHVVASLVGSVELPVVGTAPGVPGPFRDNNYTGACGRGRCGRGESEEWVVNGGGGGRGSGGAGGGGGGRVGVGGWGGWWGKWGWGFRSTCYEKAQSSMRGWVGKSVHTWA